MTKALRFSRQSARHIGVNSDTSGGLSCMKETVAGEPVSRILSSAPFAIRTARRGDHSSRSRFAPRLQQPTRGFSSPMACATANGTRPLSKARSSSRAGSPLLFGLAPRGVFRASGVTTEAVGSYPTFSPLPNVACISSASRRFPCATATVLRSAGGLFSVALSVTPL